MAGEGYELSSEDVQALFRRIHGIGPLELHALAQKPRKERRLWPEGRKLASQDVEYFRSHTADEFMAHVTTIYRDEVDRLQAVRDESEMVEFHESGL